MGCINSKPTGQASKTYTSPTKQEKEIMANIHQQRAQNDHRSKYRDNRKPVPSNRDRKWDQIATDWTT